ncbi:CaiB/BaiF CoA transferase family protein [Simiduia agarivorans]|uniref:L-carnitine dehydratase/bile acid-inducible protein F n=1 Tax=Simiduia agarivorans (strain DSM 21679 / JCM 13881 / BCRC 17597 / SA1) TaxID=1117647 RepID=K4KMU7_SIMAS|nr:CaiB/BaiF CoA-transferase family protein [Simiduia agarivorans]AFV00500.1 L-carnitine dehydratase/bile acid-inducible protein F [Simiduia agarivorans SA1 = DSM 21679]
MNDLNERPLAGLWVLDFSQFLSGPCASLRLADLGARVTKIEKPDGDDCRKIYLSDCELAGESTLFHAINRDKESVCIDLHTDAGLAQIHQLIRQADIVISNFRPGVMARLGLEKTQLRKRYPHLIVAEISGYGSAGPWSKRPGQDLLLQAVSGLCYLSGNKDDGPVPMGVPVADIYTGQQLVQGILAAVFEREFTGHGSLVEISMLEAMMDFQFEPLTILLNDKAQTIERAGNHGAHALVAGAYGLYQTADGWLALSMGPVAQLAELLSCPALPDYTDPALAFRERDAIKAILGGHLTQQSTQHWLAILEPADIWCAEVLDWPALVEHEGFTALNMLQTLPLGERHITTSRCPIRMDGDFFWGQKAAPVLGRDSQRILADSSEKNV